MKAQYFCLIYQMFSKAMLFWSAYKNNLKTTYEHVINMFSRFSQIEQCHNCLC